jgi:hypothetical protein
LGNEREEREEGGDGRGEVVEREKEKGVERGEEEVEPYWWGGAGVRRRRRDGSEGEKGVGSEVSFDVGCLEDSASC